MNGGGGGGGGSGQFPNADPSQAADPSASMTAVDHAAYKESVVRVKDLKDLVLPSPPENAGQARGFVNQVLMAIGRLQKTPGDEGPKHACPPPSKNSSRTSVSHG